MDDQTPADSHEERLFCQRVLELTSAWLGKVLTADKFLRLLRSSLSLKLFTSHVSVLVYDKTKRCYLVRMTTGPNKIPKFFLKVNESSALINDLAIHLDIKKCSESARAEMKRLNAEMCFPIFVRAELTGILLVGPRPDGVKHSEETIRFFNILTNEIGVQFEKESYYLNSITDPLTSLYNRKYMEENLFNLVKGNFKTQSGRIALALIDIDHFKLINDRLGHNAGDEVLKTVSHKIQRSVRATDQCYRYGGEEFCILFRDLVRRDGTVVNSSSDAYVESILKLIARLKSTIGENTVCWKDQQIRVTVSIGVTFLSVGTRICTVSSLIDEADNMLYAAKRAGRNRILVNKLF